MIALALWSAGALALLTAIFTIVSAALGRPESLGFVRLTLTGLFGVVLGQAIEPLDIRCGGVRQSHSDSWLASWLAPSF